MTDAALPPCGLYRTTAPIDEVPAGRFVYFHNHGEPGPGVYLPEAWSNNVARFSRRGVTLPDVSLAQSLKPLPREGLYAVAAAFTCCEKNCRTYAPNQLVQLGYNGSGEAILFLPTCGNDGVGLPDRGTRIDDEQLSKLTRLQTSSPAAPTAPSAETMH